MSVAYMVYCTTCKTVGEQSERSLKAIRAELRANGWSVNQSGGFDYCPTHWRGRKAPIFGSERSDL